MTMSLIWIIVLLQALAAGNQIFWYFHLARFERDHPSLQTPEDLERFKEMAAAQMKAALVQLFILATPGLVFIYGFFLGILEGAHVVFVVVPSFLIILLALFVRGTEKRVQKLPCADELQEERDAVVHTWISKPLPDW